MSGSPIETHPLPLFLQQNCTGQFPFFIHSPGGVIIDQTAGISFLQTTPPTPKSSTPFPTLQAKVEEGGEKLPGGASMERRITFFISLTFFWGDFFFFQPPSLPDPLLFFLLSPRPNFSKLKMGGDLDPHRVPPILAVIYIYIYIFFRLVMAIGTNDDFFDQSLSF